MKINCADCNGRMAWKYIDGDIEVIPCRCKTDRIKNLEELFGPKQVILRAIFSATEYLHQQNSHLKSIAVHLGNFYDKATKVLGRVS